MTNEPNVNKSSKFKEINIIFGILIVGLIFIATYQYTQINYLENKYSVVNSMISSLMILDNRTIESNILTTKINNFAILRDIDVWKSTLTSDQISTLANLSLKFNCLKMYDITAAGFGSSFVQFIWETNNNTAILFDLPSAQTLCSKNYVETDCNTLCSYVEL